MVNQKIDFSNFCFGPKYKKSYNQTMTDKLAWLENNKKLLVEHFKIKYNNDNLNFDDFVMEGIFIVNSPTFYMYNADYRIYTISQIDKVISGQFTDPTFTVLIVEDEFEKFITVKYPYFKKPKYLTYESLDEETNDS